MKYQDFIKRIQETTGETSPKEAKRIAEIVLGILGQRLSRILRKHLAAQLPGELHSAPLADAPAQIFTLEEFYNQVASQLDITFHEGIVTARAVMDVVVEAIAPGEISEILTGLPLEFAELFGRVPAGQSSVDVHPLAPSAS